MGQRELGSEKGKGKKYHWDMQFFFSFEKQVAGMLSSYKNWSINPLITRAVHDVMMWNTNSKITKP